MGLRAHVRLPQGKAPTEKYLSGTQNVPRVADPGGQTKGHPRLWKEEVRECVSVGRLLEAKFMCVQESKDQSVGDGGCARSGQRQVEHWGPRGSDLWACPRWGDLPALVNEVDGQGADDEDAQAGDEHVVDGAEMRHLHQLAAGTGPVSGWGVRRVAGPAQAQYPCGVGTGDWELATKGWDVAGTWLGLLILVASLPQSRPGQRGKMNLRNPLQVFPPNT